MKIEVTQEDIDQGKRKDCCLCPVALALRRHFPTALVGLSDVYIATAEPAIPFPISVQRFIRKFDRGLDVKPFSFELEVPGEN